MNDERDNLARSTPVPPLDAVPADLRNLVDGYAGDALDAAGMAGLEDRLRADPAARRFFARYLRLDRHLAMEAHARTQSDAVLARIGADGVVGRPSAAAAGRAGPRTARRLAVAAAVAGAAGAGWLVAVARGPGTASSFATAGNPNPPGTVATGSSSVPAATPAADPARPAPDVAWLVNAQDCRWAGGLAPADLRAGTVLTIDGGLAELRFRSGANLLLAGPARLELLTGNSARLHRGRATGRVAGPVKGFELFAPGGRVVDLGTEFGVAVGDAGQTDVVVFDGRVQAYAAAAVGKTVSPATAVAAAKPVDLVADQTARLDPGQVVTVRAVVAAAANGGDPSSGVTAAVRPADFVRRIVPPPVVEPRTLRVNFAKGYAGTIADAAGFGTGLTHRLPGTGGALPAAGDPNLAVDPAAGHLALTTTDTDINGQARLGVGEYLGVRLADLGFTGPEDFEVQMVVPNIPALRNVGQFGLYAGSRSDKVTRGGLISRGNRDPDAGRYELFMTNNDGGRDADSDALGLLTRGADVRMRLARTAGRYALTVENLSTGSAGTLAVRHPAFLDAENDLYVGLFGANTQSGDARRTLLVTELAVTVWTTNRGAGGSNGEDADGGGAAKSATVAAAR